MVDRLRSKKSHEILKYLFYTLVWTEYSYIHVLLSLHVHSIPCTQVDLEKEATKQKHSKTKHQPVTNSRPKIE